LHKRSFSPHARAFRFRALPVKCPNHAERSTFPSLESLACFKSRWMGEERLTWERVHIPPQKGQKIIDSKCQRKGAMEMPVPRRVFETSKVITF